MYFDIHAHIHGSEYDADRDEVVRRAYEKGVSIITVGTDYEESQKAVMCAEKYDSVYATVGIHPVDKIVEFDREKLCALVSHKKVVAIGECGLDYFWPSKGGWATGEAFEKNRQKELFMNHIRLAHELHVPLMIHGRPSQKSMDAYEDILTCLDEAEKEGMCILGNVHFFVGTLDIAKRFWDKGCTTSFTGVITFTDEYNEVIRSAPDYALMAETDAPYVTPVPYRGTRNESQHVRYVYEKIAELRGVSVAHCAEMLANNRKRIFGI